MEATPLPALTDHLLQEARTDSARRAARTVCGGSDHTLRQTVIALVPTSEMSRYAIELRSLSGGRGRFHAAHNHYDVLPAHLVDSVKREVAEEA